MITKSCLISLLFCTSLVLKSQVFYSPAYGLKSPETMEITRIENTPTGMIIYLSVENRIKGGTFCADRNIFIGYPDGSRLKLTSSKGIPVCPESYTFRKTGEKLEFSLVFPPLKPGTGWFDLIEDCSDNCFSIYGIILDPGISARINEAILDVDRGELDTAIKLYAGLIDNLRPSEAGVAGSLYTDLIELLLRKGYSARAAEYYKMLVGSDVPRKALYVNNLNARGVRF